MSQKKFFLFIHSFSLSACPYGSRGSRFKSCLQRSRFPATKHNWSRPLIPSLSLQSFRIYCHHPIRGLPRGLRPDGWAKRARSGSLSFGILRICRTTKAAIFLSEEKAARDWATPGLSRFWPDQVGTVLRFFWEIAFRPLAPRPQTFGSYPRLVAIGESGHVWRLRILLYGSTPASWPRTGRAHVILRSPARCVRWFRLTVYRHSWKRRRGT